MELNISEVNDFQEIKKKAYLTAIIGLKANFDTKWKQNFIEKYTPSKIVSCYKELVDIYQNYLLKKEDKETAKQKVESIQVKFKKEPDPILDLLTFMTAVNVAFVKEKKDFGEVTFKCPLCNGNAYASQIEILGRVVSGSQCKSCGFSHED